MSKKLKEKAEELKKKREIGKTVKEMKKMGFPPYFY